MHNKSEPWHILTPDTWLPHAACNTRPGDPVSELASELRCRPPSLAEVPVLCLHPRAMVPLHLYHHLPVMSPTHENAIVHDLHKFWRQRGYALSLPIHQCNQLDPFELLRQVALRGGYWGCTAAQVRAPSPTPLTPRNPATLCPVP